ncbi:D-erythrulose reductase-like [Ruditapes philippinarum]|uniref:D-erythrulose reductase-like n=1 Tax=Ruditapes philippinarum TaxID=129788 RepID=UPI00295C37FF|nr:D-erythrulose reductase-like [Ruditapes philippinarum]
MEDTSFQGKRALVTGAGKGIGRAIAVKLASLGAKVYGISRTQSDLDNLKQQVPSIETRFVDISDWDNTRKVVGELGPIDLLVNNAGITNWTGFLDVTKEELDNLHDINFRAAFNISQVVARGMAERGTGGAIVNISSIAAMRVVPNHTCYCTAKAALDMLAMTLAYELGPKKIRVNSVDPTIVLTELGKRGWSDPVKKANAIAKIPIGRLAEEEDVVNATIFLLSDKSSMINGAILPVDGGMVVSCV